MNLLTGGKRLPLTPQITKALKLTFIFITIALVHVSAHGVSQTVTFSGKNVSLENIFTAIKKQTGYVFFYDANLLQESKPVTLDLKNVPLENALEKMFIDQPLTWQMVNKTITIIKKPITANDVLNGFFPPPLIDVHGKVVNEKGEAVAGVTVTVKGTKNATSTDVNGFFEIKNIEENATLVFTSINMEAFEVKVSGKTDIAISLKTKVTALEDVVINKGYYSTSQKLNTGNVGVVKSEDIQKQPVNNPLAALEGRIPGLTITQSSGVNGSGFKVELRGQSSLIQGSDPLFIIDGVPYSPGNSPLNQLSSAAGYGTSSSDGISPFSLINPSNIESIEILKDADATAIYGSRGANGVILITTKKGKPGKTIVYANVYSGMSRVTRTMDMLNTQQYVQMRREAFINDGITPDASNAPDLFLWDTTRYTNFKKLLIGNSAHTADAQLSMSGGNVNTQFLISGGFNRQTTVFPTDLGDISASAHFNFNHTSTDKKLIVNLNTNYSSNVNDLPATDLTGYINTAPNFKIYNSLEKLNWQEGGVTYYSLGMLNANPLSFKEQSYKGKFENLSSNLLLIYKLLPDLSLKVNMGYNVVTGNEVSLYPSTSFDPNIGIPPYSNFATQTQKSWIIEPQAEYVKRIGKNKLDILIGNTWQDNTGNGIVISAYNYSSDLLLSSIAAAGGTQSANSFNQYRYDGLYGRVSYNIDEKFIFNLSGRRDGSSRFGPDNRFSKFGAIGAAWIFSESHFLKNKLAFLSFGKLRGSYGLTGNDQIGNYKYLDTWAPGSTTYQGGSVLNPTSLYNPSYSWEKNRKAEIAMDLGFFNDRLLVSAAYFNSRSNNQLVNYTLPTQTGFSSVLENLNALIQNKGLEFQVNSKNIVSNEFTWSSSLNLTLPENKLLAFPGLATSSYANTFVVGQSLSTRKLYHYLGVDPASGIYQFQDVDQNGILNNTDRTSLKNTDPKFYGGLQNSFRYKRLEFSFFLEFKKQNGYNYLNTLGGNVPGYFYVNQPVVVLSRWQQAADKTNIEKFTSTPGSVYTAASNYLIGSDAIISDASFIRLKNLSLSYNLPLTWLSKLHISNSRVYLQSENLFTITKYVGADPENQNIYILPPLKAITVGIQFTL
ncbi:MAG: hypothetical protein JWO92_1181 [Chitinophagaceae bacterium]|nr:hypothetical protein [Chitinophagaceae bacterium]